MTGAALFPSFPLRRRAAYRLRFALAASAAGHLLLALVMATEPLGGKARSEVPASLTVRLAPQPATETAGPALPEPEIPVAVPRVVRRPPILDSEPRTTAATADVLPTIDAPAPSLPRVPDSTYYAARDLDEYPRPVVPLDIQRLADRAVASSTAALRLEVLIDEHGVVNDISFSRPKDSARLEEELRTVLLSTRFLPARKDGRAVKSRITLRVDLGQERREP